MNGRPVNVIHSDTNTRIELSSQARRLVWIQRGLAVYHFITFAVFLTLSLVFNDKTFKIQLTQTSLQGNGSGSLEPVTRFLTPFSISWLGVPVPLITFVFHALSSFPQFWWGRTFLRMALNNGRAGTGVRPFGWWEYSLSAGLMNVLIAVLVGVTELDTLILFGGLNFIMQIVGGYWHEVVNRNWQPGKPVIWWPFLMGWVPFLLIWLVNIKAYAYAITSSSNTVPWFVHVTFSVMGVLFSLFVLPIIFHYLPCDGYRRSNFWYEVAYSVLSLVAKQPLDVIIIVVALTR